VGQTITLSVLEFDILWEHLQLGPFPPILAINSHGTTLGERAKLAATAWESLADKDLGWPDRLDGRVAFRLRLLARPEWELDARLHLSAEGPATKALIAANTSTATIAVLDTERLILRTAPTDMIAMEAIGLLPPHPPAGGPSITLPASALDIAVATAATPTSFAAALTSAGLGPSESRMVATLASTAIRHAHFGAARTRRFEKRRRANHVVSVYDTPHGRYLFTRKPSNGQHWVTLLPGSPAAIIRQLTELLDTLA
jgi:hypothetical protein